GEDLAAVAVDEANLGAVERLRSRRTGAGHDPLRDESFDLVFAAGANPEREPDRRGKSERKGDRDRAAEDATRLEAAAPVDIEGVLAIENLHPVRPRLTLLLGRNVGRLAIDADERHVVLAPNEGHFLMRPSGPLVRLPGRPCAAGQKDRGD